jgi:hypothetical protein
MASRGRWGRLKAGRVGADRVSKYDFPDRLWGE